MWMPTLCDAYAVGGAVSAYQLAPVGSMTTCRIYTRSVILEALSAKSAELCGGHR